VGRTRRVGRAREPDCAKVVIGARQEWTAHGDRAGVDRATRVSRTIEMDWAREED